MELRIERPRKLLQSAYEIGGGGVPVSGSRWNNAFTDGRFNTMIAKTPSAVPNGKFKQVNTARMKQNQ
jgi:hypothetical protein